MVPNYKCGHSLHDNHNDFRLCILYLSDINTLFFFLPMNIQSFINQFDKCKETIYYL